MINQLHSFWDLLVNGSSSAVAICEFISIIFVGFIAFCLIDGRNFIEKIIIIIVSIIVSQILVLILLAILTVLYYLVSWILLIIIILIIMTVI